MKASPRDTGTLRLYETKSVLENEKGWVYYGADWIMRAEKVGSWMVGRGLVLASFCVILGGCGLFHKEQSERELLRGKKFYQRGRYEDAINVLSPLVAEDSEPPDKAPALYFLWACYRALGQQAVAKQILKQLKESYPGSVWSELAELKLCVEGMLPMRKVKGVSWWGRFRRAVKETFVPVPAEIARYRRAKRSYKKGKWEEAVREFGEFLSNYPDSPLNPPARFFSAESYRKLGNTEKAREYYRVLVKEEGTGWALLASQRLRELGSR